MAPRRPSRRKTRTAASDNLALIQAALSEARGLDQGGKESECMDAITRAKRLAG